MRVVAQLIAIAFLTTTCIAQTPSKKLYRPRAAHRAARPKATGDPVVVNAASFEPGISPGSLATVFGTDLTSVNGTIIANTNPLPLELGGVSVDVNGVPAPMYSVAFSNGFDVISFQVPLETPAGPSAGEVDVFDQGDMTASLVADSFTEDPGIFVYGEDDAIAVATADGSLIGPDNPAIAGEILALYTTGLGPVSITVDDGFAAPDSPPVFTVDPVNVFLAGEGCDILFSGLAPGFVGVYQINFRVPPDAPPGILSLQIETPFTNSSTVNLPVR